MKKTALNWLKEEAFWVCFLVFLVTMTALASWLEVPTRRDAGSGRASCSCHCSREKGNP